MDWAGGVDRATASPRRGTSSSPGRRSTALAAVVRGLGRAAARRAADRLPRRGAGGGRRPARPAVGGAPRRRARRRLRGALRLASSTSASTTTPRPVEELARLYRIHQALFGKTPADEWLELDAALERSCATRLARLGYDGDLADAFRAWAGRENLEERVDGIERIDPVVLEELRRAMKRLGGDELRRARLDPALRGARLAPGAPAARDPRLRDQRLHGRRRSGELVIEEHDETGGGAGGHEELYVVIAGRATFTLDGESLDAPAGTLVFISDPSVKRKAVARGGRHARARDRRRARRRLRALAVGVVLRGDARLPGGALGRGDRADGGRASRSGRVTRRSSTTSPAPSRAAAGRSTRSPICRRRSRATPSTPTGPARTRTSTRSAASPAFRPRRVARQPARRRRARGTPEPGLPAGLATRSTAPKPSSGVSASTSSWRPTASANALCACVPAERREVVLGRAAGEHVAVGEVPHRDVGDDRAAVGRRDRDRERVRPGQLRPAVGMAEPARRGRGERGDEARLRPACRAQ